MASQKNIGDMACGPCALYNALNHGHQELRKVASELSGRNHDQRIQSLIRKHGQQPSEIYQKKQARYTAKGGITVEDLPGFVRDTLGVDSGYRVAADYLNRRDKESQGQHLLRVHRLLRQSIRDGFPPIVEVRSFAAQKNKAGEYEWNGLLGHFIAITRVPEQLADADKGFSFQFADSDTGKIAHGYIHMEEARNFTAVRAFSVSEKGEDQWQWVTDYPYLLVQAPSLRLLTQKEPWHHRTLIILRHAVTATPSQNKGP